MKLTIQISKTAQGTHDYVQIMSDDLMTTNIVLIADRVEVRDDRDKKPAAKIKKGKS